MHFTFATLPLPLYLCRACYMRSSSLQGINYLTLEKLLEFTTNSSGEDGGDYAISLLGLSYVLSLRRAACLRAGLLQSNQPN